jgi:hypothetical protein
MPRFFMHVREADELIEDLDGSDLPDLEAARSEATAAAREIAAEHLKAGKALGVRRIEIRDDAGRMLATVPFPEVPIAR